MKSRGVLMYFLLCGLASVFASPVSPVSFIQNEDIVKCNKGPVYWCTDIKTAKSCGAVRHCIQTVWEYAKLPEDNDNICKICKDMVAEARAQLESNQTQEELKEVFEGTCAFIPLKSVAKECMKLADEFVPELVETLASQMNPQVVCSVAGLCNNAMIDKLLAENKIANSSQKKHCDGCYTVTAQMRERFTSTRRDELLNNMLEVCGRLGSFSDSCSAIVVSYFDVWYNHLQSHLVPEEVCNLAGMCSYKFHDHRVDNVELTIESAVGVVKTEKDDLPCDFCEQLIVHLRDILIANTTESEFQHVLKGICKQTGSFADECVSIVEEYYGAIYDFLVNSLNPKEVCSMLGVCPVPGNVMKGPIWPLLPVDAAKHLQSSESGPVINQMVPMEPAVIVGQDEANSYKLLQRVPLGKKGIKVTQAAVLQPAQPAQLPIERMMPQTVLTLGNKELCTFCEYFLHYLQQVLSTPSTEAQIKHTVETACEHLPSQFKDECHDFVETYGDAAIALLVQEIDPSQVCPSLGICPSQKVLIDLSHSVDDKPTCPLCLLAVKELDDTLQVNKTEESIRKGLEKLCKQLPQSLIGECQEFVDKYSEQLVDMLIADFTPQEVCVFLKLCDPSPKPELNEILSNEIPSGPSYRAMPQDIINSEVQKMHGEACVVCEFVMSKIEEELKDKKTEDEIKTVVHEICDFMPSTVAKECNGFVNQYADLVIALLAESLDPKSVCTELKLCISKAKIAEESLTDCAVCDEALGQLGSMMSIEVVNNITYLLQKVCFSVPEKHMSKCHQLTEIYGPSIVNLSEQHKDFQKICEMIGKCPKDRQVVNLLGGKKCTWGPSYWCQSENHAAACGAKLHCQENVWKGEKPN